MKYFCLIYFDEVKLVVVLVEEFVVIVDECMIYFDQLGKVGYYIVLYVLQLVQIVIILCYQGGWLVMIDGLFVEIKE